ncbi:hypothetical protein GCM10017608_17910 [Agromyces luteolus]|nr:hypothetical protein GCM10017608_17910 [Agromyces luteolus]
MLRERRREPLQRGEGHRRLGLVAVGAHDAEAARRADRLVEDRALADARFAADEEGAAVPVARAAQQRTEPFELVGAPEDRGRGGVDAA